MKRGLLIETKYNNITKKMKLYSVPNKLYKIGSLSKSDLKVISTHNDKQIYGALEFKINKWKLLDLTSTGDLLKSLTNQNELEIIKKTIFKINDTEITLKPIQAYKLFTDTSDIKGKYELQEVIVFLDKKVIFTKSFDNKSAISIKLHNSTIQIPKAKSNLWETLVYENYELKFRLIEKAQLSFSSKFNHKIKFTIVGLTLVFLLFLISVLLNFNEITPDKVPEDKMTKMIYDAKILNASKKSIMDYSKQLIEKVENENIDTSKNTKTNDISKSLSKNKSTNESLKKLKNSGIKNIIKSLFTTNKFSNINSKISNSVGSRITGAEKGTVFNDAEGISDTLNSKNTAGLKKGVGTSGKAIGTGFSLNTGLTGNSSVTLLENESIVEGGLTKDQIQKVIEAHIGEIRYCYDRALNAQPDINGKINVKFIINQNGIVDNPTVFSSSVGNVNLEGCLLRRLATWKFPIPKAGMDVLVKYPFILKSTK